MIASLSFMTRRKQEILFLLEHPANLGIFVRLYD